MNKILMFTSIAFLSNQAFAKVSKTECDQLTKQVGQLFYINVDGFGSDYTIHPAYENLIKKMQPGGVLPHYNSKNIDSIREASLRLQLKSDLPLMIGIDYQSMNGVEIGLGYGEGLAGKIKSSDVSCFEKIGKIEAALHQYAGINNPLGPTVEYNTSKEDAFPAKETSYRRPRLRAIMDSFRSSGLETTIKHFPYTPSDYNLHKTSKDTKIPSKKVDEKFMPIYKELGKSSGLLMTTHLMNSNIDPSNMATFSKVWMNKLRNEVGFKGIVMTDALFMINSYPETMKKMSRDWPARLSKEFNKDLSIFAIKAILAGHDMVFLETAAKETEAVWKDVAKFACTDDPLSADFRKRVATSYQRITSYKKSNMGLKDTKTSLTKADIDTLIKAKKNQDSICEKETPELDAIFDKAARTPTKISEDVFNCEDSLGLNSVLSEELRKLDQQNLVLLKQLISQGLKSQNPDDMTATLTYLENNPELKVQLRDSLKNDLTAADKKTKFDAFKTLSDLDFSEDGKGLINDIIQTLDLECFEKYVGLSKTNKVPPPDAQVSLDARLKLLQEYLKKHPLDLSKPAKDQSAQNAIQILFSGSLIAAAEKDFIDHIGLGIDETLLFKVPRIIYNQSELTKAEYLRLIEINLKNPSLSDFDEEDTPNRVSDLFNESNVMKKTKELSATERAEVLKNIRSELKKKKLDERQNSRNAYLSIMELIIADDPKISYARQEAQLKEMEKILGLSERGASDRFTDIGYEYLETIKMLGTLGQKEDPVFKVKLEQIILKNENKLDSNSYVVQRLKELIKPSP